jgi:WD40 repeat protein
MERGESHTCAVLTVAVADYDDESRNRAVLEDVGTRFASLFKGSGSTHVVSSLLLTPRVGEAELWEALAAWGASKADVGLLLWTGHGERDGQEMPQLSVSETWIDAPVLAIKMRNLGFRRWIIIIDTCFAASVIEQCYPYLHRAAKYESGSCVLLGSSDATDPSDAGVFTKTLIRVLEEGPKQDWWGFQEAFLNVNDVMEKLDKMLPDIERAVPQIGGAEWAPRAFPNPLYRAESFPIPLDEKHFLGKAKGIEPGASGWFFTGRVEALERIVAWLNLPGNGFLVVTGPAGTGKSAIIGRVVTMSVRRYRDRAERDGALAQAESATLPELGSVTAAFHAREKRVDELLAFLAQPLEATGVLDVKQLIDSPRVRRGGVVIAVDALDEASSGHARRMLHEVLSPLARTPGVKVLIGTRPKVAEWISEFNVPAENIIDLAALDGTETDIAEYARQRLLRIEGSPYARRDDLARTIGKGVAVRALSDPLPDGRRVGSFLVARIITKTLAAQREITPEPGWEERLPSGFAEAFEVDLNSYADRLGEAAKSTIRAVLEALAWDEGQGVPRRLIPALTRAVTGAAIGDNDIIMVLQHAAGHLLEAQAGGWALYRLYHKRLQEHLRGLTRERETLRSDGDAAIHARIAEALIAVGIASDWADVDPYLAGVLAEHARLGGRLDTLLATAGYIEAAEPSDLLSALPLTADGEVGAIIRTYRRASHVLRGARPQERYVALQIAAARNAETVQLPLKGAISLRWLHSRPAAELQTLTGHVGSVNAVQLGDIEGRVVVVSGGTDCTVRIWDLARGTAVGEPLRGHQLGVQAVALGKFNGRMVAVSGGEDGTVRVWDAASGIAWGEPPARGEPWVTAVALGGRKGSPVAVSGRWDGTLRILDLGSGRTETLTGHRGWVLAVAVGECGGREVAVSGGEDGTVRVWYLDTGTQAGEPMRGHKGRVNAVAVGESGGRQVAVSGGEDGTVRVWYLDTRTQAGEPLRGHQDSVKAVAIRNISGRAVAVSGGQDGGIRVWDLASSTAAGTPSQPFAPSAVAIGDLGRREVAVSGGEDGTVRVWDLTSGALVSGPLPAHEGRVSAVAAGVLGGRELAVSGGDDGTIRVWDLTSYTSMEPLRGHQGPVQAVAIGELNGGGIAVSGAEDGTVGFWDLARGELIGRFRGHNRPVYGVAIGQYDGSTVGVSADRDGRVQVWNLAQLGRLGPTLRGHQPRLRTIVAGEMSGKAVAVCGSSDATVRVWDLANGTFESADLPLPGHRVRAVTVGKMEGRPVAILGSDDGTVQIWELASRHAYLTLPVLDQVRAIAIGSGTILLATGSGILCLKCQDMSAFGSGHLPVEYDPKGLTENQVAYDSEKLLDPFIKWRRYTRPQSPYSLLQIQAYAVTEDRPAYVELRAVSTEAVGVNFTLNITSGIVKFEYEAEGPPDKLRAYLTVIPMQKTGGAGTRKRGIELGGDGPLDPRNATSPHRVRFHPPLEHYSIGAWHEGSLEFDFSHMPEVSYSVLGARVNEGCENPGPALFRLRKVRVLKSAPHITSSEGTIG